MKRSPSSYHLTEDAFGPADARLLLDTAAELYRAEEAGLAPALLRGKHIALMCDDPQCEAARLFQDAAARLGARVSRIRPDSYEAGVAYGERDVRALGLLYDAVECEHAPAEVAQRLRRSAGVPVFNGVTRPGHALMRLPAAAEPTEAQRRSLVQALLVLALG